jgi:uncharacterized protein (DUF427 family)
MTTEAYWNKQRIAASADCILVEGNAYFPPDSVDMAFLLASALTSVCGWKGTAGYFDVVVDGVANANAAWVYDAPLAAAERIAGYIAFWKGVEVRGANEAKPMPR